MGLSKVRRRGESFMMRKNGNYLYYYREMKDYWGTGYYIRKEIFDRIHEIKSVSEKIDVLK